MNKRQRKKQLKNRNAYVSSRECWNLDITFAEFAIPRLKKFKQDNNITPWCRHIDEDRFLTDVEWDIILDKMIRSFEYAKKDVDDIYGYDAKGEELLQNCKEYQATIQEGLQLFALYFQDLWW